MEQDEKLVQYTKIFLALAFGTVICVLLWNIHHDNMVTNQLLQGIINAANK